MDRIKKSRIDFVFFHRHCLWTGFLADEIRIKVSVCVCVCVCVCVGGGFPYFVLYKCKVFYLIIFFRELEKLLSIF